MNAMHADDIARIAAWLKATDIALLELRGPGTALRLEQHAGSVTVEAIAPDATGEIVVRAPAVGVLLHRHPLRGDDLVAPGDAVEAGRVIALLQVGPLLLPVHASTDAVMCHWIAPHGAPSATARRSRRCNR